MIGDNNNFFIVSYIDPGTGSLLISTIIGFFLTIIYNLKDFFYKILAQISGGLFKNNNDHSGKIVFFNEGEKYWNVFKPVLNELSKNNQYFVYLTADKNDPGLHYKYNKCEKYYIGNIHRAIIVLNTLKATLCIMTTPQLNILDLKRSKHVDHYCNILHAPSDIHVYKKFAFDDFDSILCSTKNQISNLRYLEEIRNTSIKKLFETGCTYYDEIKLPKKSNGDSILIASTWGDKSFLTKHGIKIIEKILNLGEKVILRPHPQSWISDKLILDCIFEKYKNNSLFEIDRSISNLNSLNKSKIIICDFSGIIYDITLIYNKPVIAFKHHWEDGGYERSDLVRKDSANYILDDFGQLISESDIPNIRYIIDKTSNMELKGIDTEKYIFNFKSASKVASEQIISLYDSLK